MEAGIKLNDLLIDLKMCGLALPTMGAGAGQSLAGALSTSSHGGDFDVPPPVEWIRAVHLVGPAGQEWWITPEASIFAGERISASPAWCDDALIVANNDAFDAVRVGVGRMGVIYSMVLEVVPQYGLVEVNLEHAWSEIREQLNTSRVSPVSGMFDASLTDLESGWFRSEVLARTMIIYLTPSYPDDSTATFRYVSGPGHAEPPENEFKERHYQEMLASLGLADFAADLRGEPPKPLRTDWSRPHSFTKDLEGWFRGVMTAG